MSCYHCSSHHHSRHVLTLYHRTTHRRTKPAQAQQHVGSHFVAEKVELQTELLVLWARSFEDWRVRSIYVLLVILWFLSLIVQAIPGINS
jgi:hypothetical protein